MLLASLACNLLVTRRQRPANLPDGRRKLTLRDLITCEHLLIQLLATLPTC